MTDLRQTKKWASFLEKKGWKVEKLLAKDGKHTINAFILRIGWWPFKMMKIQRSEFEIDFEELKRVKRKHLVVNTAIEPLSENDGKECLARGYWENRYPFLALSTIRNDLRVGEDTLWRNLSENAKRMIKKNNDLQIREVDVEEFCRHWKKNAKIWIMKEKELAKLKASFDKKMRLVIGYCKGECCSGILLLESRDIACYYHSFTSKLGRQNGAHYKLCYEEMLRAKRKGLKIWDFEGIYDSRSPQKKWLGFSEFKRKFGGEVLRYPGSYFRWF